MNPNAVGIARVWTAESGMDVLDVTFPTGADFDVVVGAEAGDTIRTSGTEFEVGIAVRDLTTSEIIHDYTTGALHMPADWPDPYRQERVTIPAAEIAGREGHCCEVVAFLRARVGDVDASFARSPMFLITSP